MTAAVAWGKGRLDVFMRGEDAAPVHGVDAPACDAAQIDEIADVDVLQA